MEPITPRMLSDVSETALWTLWNRGIEAAREDSRYEDALTMELIERIDYPYRERFGLPLQVFAMRASAYDSVIRDYVSRQPGGAVVALGEGLQTTYWRVGRPELPWFSVDLAPIIALRERVLPHEEHVVNVATSVLDRSWMQLVPTTVAPLITAEGLFMYFDEPTVLSLIADCATQFPGGRLIFDGVPEWWKRKKGKTVGGRPGDSSTHRYAIPPMRSALSARAAADLPGQIPGVATVRAVPVPPGRGFSGRMQRIFYQGHLVPGRWRGSLAELRFGQTGHEA